MKNTALNILKVLLLYLIASILCALQAYISMYEYRDNNSSSGRNLIYRDDVVLSAFFFTLFFLLVYLLIHLVRFLVSRYLLKSKKLKIGRTLFIITVFFILACLTTNLDIFESRVSSWSTFTIAEEFSVIIHASYLYLLLLSVVFYFSGRILFAGSSS